MAATGGASPTTATIDLRISSASQRPLRSYAEARVYWVFLKAGGGIKNPEFSQEGGPIFSARRCIKSGTNHYLAALPTKRASERQGSVSISPEYHRRQAATLTQLAQTTRDPNAAEALLRIAAEDTVRADQAVRTLTPLDEALRATTDALNRPRPYRS